MNPSLLTRLNKEEAATLVELYKTTTLDLYSLEELTPEVADELAKHQGMLSFNNLQHLSCEAAFLLSRHNLLCFPSLEIIDTLALRALINAPWRNFIKTLSTNTRGFSRCLNMTSLKANSRELIQEIMYFRGSIRLPKESVDMVVHELKSNKIDFGVSNFWGYPVLCIFGQYVDIE